MAPREQPAKRSQSKIARLASSAPLLTRARRRGGQGPGHASLARLHAPARRRAARRLRPRGLAEDAPCASFGCWGQGAPGSGEVVRNGAVPLEVGRCALGLSALPARAAREVMCFAHLFLLIIAEEHLVLRCGAWLLDVSVPAPRCVLALSLLCRRPPCACVRPTRRCWTPARRNRPPSRRGTASCSGSRWVARGASSGRCAARVGHGSSGPGGGALARAAGGAERELLYFVFGRLGSLLSISG